MTAIEIARHPKAVTDFIDEVKSAESDDDARNLRLQEIHSLVKFSQRFYIAFFAAELKSPLRITGFQYRDKRRVSRRLIVLESRKEVDGEAFDDSQFELGGYFEELVDSLQGDLDFGYSTDLADFSEFHEEIYPGWLDTLSSWCGYKGDGTSKQNLASLAKEYRDVARL